MSSHDDNFELRTFSLAEVAAMVLPKEWAAGERWLTKRLNRNEIHGYKVGRTWRMTEADVNAMIDRYSNTVSNPRDPAEPTSAPGSVAAGLSPRSRRRLNTLP